MPIENLVIFMKRIEFKSRDFAKWIKLMEENDFIRQVEFSHEE